MYRITLLIFLLFGLGFSGLGCSMGTLEPVAGPDKQGVGTWGGIVAGGAAGGIIGFQELDNLGPGIWVGAAMGGLYGMLRGIGIDLLEENQIERIKQDRELRELAWVQDMLADHYKRRLELHPDRDIFPADWFFDGDGVKLRRDAKALVKEIAIMTKHRMPWSRMVIASYVTSNNLESDYAKYLSEERAKSIALAFIRSGIEPRRVLIRGVPLSDPVVIDPYDSPSRYRQAIEIIPLDY